MSATVQYEDIDGVGIMTLDDAMSLNAWTQCEGEAIVEIRAGDVIWCPPGHKHWHGATPTTAMTHIAIQEALDGNNVHRLER